MKLIYIFLTILLLIGCSGEQTETQNQTATENQTDYTFDDELYHQAAQKLVNVYSKELKSALMSAMNDGGPINALEVCSGEAPEIGDKYSIGSWSIRRVSSKFRNPLNRATSDEMRFLAQFNDSLPPEDFTTWDEIDSVTTYHYYQPIRTMDLCLKCHGDLQTMTPDVYQKIKKLYPLDRATGYKADELRGMFVVEAPWPEGKEFAELFLKDSVDFEAVDTIESIDSVKDSI